MIETLPWYGINLLFSSQTTIFMHINKFNINPNWKPIKNTYLKYNLIYSFFHGSGIIHFKVKFITIFNTKLTN